MSIDIGSAISNGIKNLYNKETGILAGLLTLAYLIQDFGIQTLEAGVGTGAETPLALGSSTTLGSALLGVSIIFGLLISIVSLRFYSSKDLELTDSMYKENLLLPSINFVLASIVFAASVFLGFILLIIPGLFLMTALYYYTFRVAVEDENVFQALKSSFNLTSGSRFELFGLGAIVTGTLFIVSIFTVPLIFIGSLAGTGVALAAMSIYNLILAGQMLLVFSIGAHAYNQLLEK